MLSAQLDHSDTSAPPPPKFYTSSTTQSYAVKNSVSYIHVGVMDWEDPERKVCKMKDITVWSLHDACAGFMEA